VLQGITFGNFKYIILLQRKSIYGYRATNYANEYELQVGLKDIIAVEKTEIILQEKLASKSADNWVDDGNWIFRPNYQSPKSAYCSAR